MKIENQKSKIKNQNKLCVCVCVCVCVRERERERERERMLKARKLSVVSKTGKEERPFSGLCIEFRTYSFCM